MVQRRYSAGEDVVMVNLGRGEHWLTVGEATELRDGLTAALGAPQTLTPGEMAVWAVEYQAQRAAGLHAFEAATSARGEVVRLRDASATANAGARVVADDVRGMLAAMTGGGK